MKNNKILFIVRNDYLKNKGGDSIQVLNTAKYLKKLGFDVDIAKSNSYLRYSSDYSILHFFNLIRPSDFLIWLRRFKKTPKVISSIFVSYKSTKNLSKVNSLIIDLFGEFFFEYLKNVYKMLISKLKPFSLEYIFLGHKKSMLKILKNSSFVLPNSYSELKRLNNIFGKIKYSVIPNGIDLDVFKKVNTDPKFEECVISVGRIEPIKNQLNIIRALSGIDTNVYIIGTHAPNHEKYYLECIKSAGKNIYFIDFVDQNKLNEIFNSAKVHVLASWFETTGLVSLEAAYCGCNIIVTETGDQKDYFKDIADFCQPDSIESIKEKVLNALAKERNYKKPQKFIEEKYTWEIAAKETAKVYNEILVISK